jgi:hypothetical protein
MTVTNIKGASILDFRLALDEGLSRSRNATQIWNWLQKPDREFDIIVLGRGLQFGQMLTEGDKSGPDAERGRQHYLQTFGGDKITRPVVLWNPHYDFDYFGDVDGVEIGAAGDIKPIEAKRAGGYVYQQKGKMGIARVRVIRVTEGRMPAWVVLFHELGHVKQYFEAGGLNGWLGRLQDTNAIEADNLADHEQPICRDLKLPLRAHYKHSALGFADVVQKYATGMNANAWKAAADVGARAQIEAALKAEADTNRQAAPDRGIFHAV